MVVVVYEEEDYKAIGLASFDETQTVLFVVLLLLLSCVTPTTVLLLIPLLLLLLLLLLVTLLFSFVLSTFDPFAETTWLLDALVWVGSKLTRTSFYQKSYRNHLRSRCAERTIKFQIFLLAAVASRAASACRCYSMKKLR